MTAEPVLCPSARCEPGAILLGLSLPDGRVAFASDRIVVNEEFVEAAAEGRPAEQRFRFAAPCVRGACKQWTGSRCGVIDAVVDHLGPTEAASLPACSIRSQCRWFGQSGPVACSACPLVVTDARPPSEAIAVSA
jgi:hypothetical protein